MKHALALTVIAALVVGSAGSAAAQRPRTTQRPAAAYKREVPARLLRQTKVSEDSALKVATARIPGGKVQALELENENGKLIWSWEFIIAGRPGVFECNVNALDGSIVGVEHEMPKTDSARARPAAPAKPRP